MTPVLLRRHVHFRRVGDNFIFLDLERDAYFSLDREKSDRLAALMARSGRGADGGACDPAERPQSGCDAIVSAPRTDRETHAIIGELAAAGLTAQIRERGKPLQPTVIAPPREELFRSGLADRTKAGAGALFAGLAACATASALLASRSLAANVAYVRRRRDRRGAPIDRNEARELVAEFAEARAYYPRRKSCLFESLALIEFLAGAGVFPGWTFGVRSDPFAAHCWVEGGGVVLNDSLETTRAFAPIFSA